MAPKRAPRDDAPKGGARDRGRDKPRDRADVDETPRVVTGAPDSHRQIRAEHVDPQVPDEVTATSLPQDVRNELKTLTPETQDFGARHLAMAA